MQALCDELMMDKGTLVHRVGWVLQAFLLIFIGLEGEQLQKPCRQCLLLGHASL